MGFYINSVLKSYLFLLTIYQVLPGRPGGYYYRQRGSDSRRPHHQSPAPHSSELGESGIPFQSGGITLHKQPFQLNDYEDTHSRKIFNNHSPSTTPKTHHTSKQQLLHHFLTPKHEPGPDKFQKSNYQLHYKEDSFHSVTHKESSYKSETQHYGKANHEEVIKNQEFQVERAAASKNLYQGKLVYSPSTKSYLPPTTPPHPKVYFQFPQQTVISSSSCQNFREQFTTCGCERTCENPLGNCVKDSCQKGCYCRLGWVRNAVGRCTVESFHCRILKTSTTRPAFVITHVSRNLQLDGQQSKLYPSSNQPSKKVSNISLTIPDWGELLKEKFKKDPHHFSNEESLAVLIQKLLSSFDSEEHNEKTIIPVVVCKEFEEATRCKCERTCGDPKGISCNANSCTAGCVCQNGWIRYNETCLPKFICNVLENQTPVIPGRKGIKCNDYSEEYEKCGCETICDYPGVIYCTRDCQGKCSCKKGFARKAGVCVPLDACTKEANPPIYHPSKTTSVNLHSPNCNSHYEEYAICGCERTCADPNGIHCDNKRHCHQKCVCKIGYARVSGICVHIFICSLNNLQTIYSSPTTYIPPVPTHGKNCADFEVYDKCGCERTCDDHHGKRCLNCIGKCVCKDDFVRIDGLCVHKWICPDPTTPSTTIATTKEGTTSLPLTCDRPNEMYLPRGPGCPPTCKDPLQETCHKPYQPGCFCRPGFINHTDINRCIDPYFCPTTSTVSTTETPPTAVTSPQIPLPKCINLNEVFSKCGPGCPPTCTDPTPVKCKEPCRPGCFCQSGFIRDSSSNLCVYPYECPHPPNTRSNLYTTYSSGVVCTKPNEEHQKCACERTCDDPNGVNCDKSACKETCICNRGFVRKNFGDCVLQSTCLESTESSQVTITTVQSTESPVLTERPPANVIVCNKPHEVFEACACERTCDDPDLEKCSVCKELCICEDRFVRNESGDCTVRSDCFSVTGSIGTGAPENVTPPPDSTKHEVTCPGVFEVFQVCACEKTCDDPEGKRCNPLSCEGSCICKEGYVRQEEICSPESECSFSWDSLFSL